MDLTRMRRIKKSLHAFHFPIYIFILNALSGIYLAQTTFTRVYAGSIVNDGGVSAGVSWIDYDNDGYVDLFVTNAQDHENFLYHNSGDGSFTKITQGAIVTDINRSSGNSWGDYDNDGDLDLFISNQQQNDMLYINNGSGNFVKLFEGNIIETAGDSHHCSWVDYNNDGFLDLFVANGGFNGAEVNFLFKSNGDGTFEKIVEREIVTDVTQSFSGNWSDYDNDGDQDLYVTCWNNRKNHLYRNDGNGVFTQIVEGNIVNDMRSSIGSSWGDYDNDGDLDLFVANWGGWNNNLYNNNGDGTFTKITSGSIVNDAGYSWSGNWGDYDNDGDLDLVVTNYDENNFYYDNNGDGTFTKISNQNISTDRGLSSACATADYDKDGDLDIFITNWENRNNFFYRNDGNTNHWISIKCVGTVSNRTAIGTKVRVKALIYGNSVWQLRVVEANTAIRSQNSLECEFGLGDAEIIDSIIVEWPSGIVNRYANIETDKFLTINEGEASSVGKNDNLPSGILLEQNYPNPFNPETNIVFSLENGSYVKLIVNDLGGSTIRKLADKYFSTGAYKIRWNGENELGLKVCSGIYVYNLITDKQNLTRKMVLIR